MKNRKEPEFKNSERLRGELFLRDSKKRIESNSPLTNQREKKSEIKVEKPSLRGETRAATDARKTSLSMA